MEVDFNWQSLKNVQRNSPAWVAALLLICFVFPFLLTPGEQKDDGSEAKAIYLQATEMLIDDQLAEEDLSLTERTKIKEELLAATRSELENKDVTEIDPKLKSAEYRERLVTLMKDMGHAPSWPANDETDAAIAKLQID